MSKINTIMTLKYLIWLVIIITSGCISQINYDVSNEKTRIVINSLLTTKMEKQTVYVKQSVLTGNNNTTNSLPITDAKVTIKTNTQLFELVHEKDGAYIATFAAMTGDAYILEVIANGQTYTSSPQTMPASYPLPTVRADLINKESINASGNLVLEKFVNINLTGIVDQDFKSLYRINGEYEFMEFNPPSTALKTCYVLENIDNNTIKILSAKDQRTDQIDRFSLLDVPFDARFVRLYAFKVSQYALSETTLSYWKKINQISNTGQNIFDAPPGKIIGNIKNTNNPSDEVLGNFTLGAVSDTIIFTNMVRLGGVVTDICQVRFNSPRPRACIDCLVLPFSTTIKPSYWPE